MAKIIGITGYGGKIAGVGKDTAARFLTEYHPRQFRSLAFADPIRAGMREIFGWDQSFFEHPKKNEVDERFGISPRKAMQTLGTEWGRQLVNTDLWLIIAGQRAEPLLAAGFNVLITDVRFENEAKWIRDNGGVIWHIERNVDDGTGGNKTHSSEAGIKFVNGDVKINNNETLGYMYDVLNGLASSLAAEEEQKRMDEEFDAKEAARLAADSVPPLAEAEVVDA